MQNQHSTLEHLLSAEPLPELAEVSADAATRVLSKLEEDSSTAPDALASRLLKHCSKPLGKPVARLAIILLDAGHWPKKWRLHWVIPLYKKRSAYDPANYRGIHLSAQLSKVVERLVAESFVPHLESAGVFGSNQFAYRKKRGCKDALAMNVIQWIWWLHLNRKVGLYCSDAVSYTHLTLPTKRIV